MPSPAKGCADQSGCGSRMRKGELMKGKLLYRTVNHNGSLVFALEDRAQCVAKMHQAIRDSRTWSEFRRHMPRREYSALLRAFANAGQPRPKGTDEFSGELLPGWTEGDYPPWLQLEMAQLIPRHILKRFGQCKPTHVNGSYWSIPPEVAAKVCVELSAIGWETEHAPDLPFW